MTGRIKSRIYQIVAIAAYAASAFFYLRANWIRFVSIDDGVSFPVYDSHDHRRFLEDYLGLLFFAVATISLIYGSWLRKK